MSVTDSTQPSDDSTAKSVEESRTLTLEAESLEAGRQQAAEQLGVPADQLRVRVVSQERRGWFGRGPEVLTLEATWSPPEPDEDAQFDVWVEQGRVYVRIGRAKGGGRRVETEQVTELLESWQVDVINDQAIAAAVRQQDEARVEVAGIRPSVAMADDAPVIIKVTEDDTEAWLIPWAGATGQPVTASLLRDLLKQARLTFGVDTKSLASVANEVPRTPVRIASAQLLVQAEDARLEYRFEGAPTTHAPSVRSDDTADFRELSFSPAVEEGAVLVAKVPPTEGIEGHSVRGQRQPVEVGRDIDLAPLAGDGTAVSEDGLTLVATSSGVPTQSKNKIAVLPTYSIGGDVDFSTGNVEFAGNLEIRGSVRPGFRIHATGSIEVGGLVDGGSLEAGGDVRVRRGVIGQGIAVLRAGGSVETAFVENAEIHAGGSVYVGNEIRQSRVIAEGAIEVQRAGRIVSGTVRARERITARRIAAPMGTKTVVQVGWGQDATAPIPEQTIRPELHVRDGLDADVLITIGNASRRLDLPSPGGVFRNREGHVDYAAN
ncbi:MAG: hypothetical protein CL878_13430 [Dehalococcoidia bacterium]|nr:hypothetical protein [Dehalococcoidia bacterium]